MTLTLRILGAQSSGEEELALCFDAPRIVIGRAPGCELVLPDPTVSARHASLRHRGTEYVIIDEGSTNGLLVGTVKLPPQTPRVVRDGELLRVGRVWLEVNLGLGVPSAPRQAEALALRLVRAQLEADGEQARPTLRVSAGPDSGKRLPLEPDHEVVIGRSQQCDWSLADDSMSRRHVSAVHREGQVWVRDLGSKRGAELAGRPLGSEPTVWPVGQSLRVGATTLELDDPAPEALGDLQRAPDERMRAVEFTEPPPGDDSAEPVALVEAPPEAPAEPETGEPERESEDDAVAAQRASGEGNGRREGHMLELVIALVALAVLAASAIGLTWLLKP